MPDQVTTGVPGDGRPLFVIQPYQLHGRQRVREILRTKFMLWNLIRSSGLRPYNDFYFGFLWTIIRPVVFLAVVVFIKNRSAAHMGNHGEYELFLFVGIISWWYFSDAALNSAKSIYQYRSIISKMYFPRIVVPVIPVVSRLLDFGLHFIPLLFLMVYFGVWPGTNIWLLPICILTLMGLALGIGLIFSVLSTLIRDVQPILTNILYVGLFMSPVIFSASLIPAEYRTLYQILNPTVGPLVNLRAALFDHTPPDLGALASSIVVTLVMLAVGTFAFMRVEDELPEKVL